MPITAIYAFARTADDIADEGDQSSAQRLKQLTEYNDELKRIHNNSPTNNRIFIALNDTIHSHQLPIQLFYDLVTAFTQDVTKTRYDCFDDVLQYCHYSANPVGRLLLHLTGQASDENLIRSDSICSALQLINFLQDISQDFHENNRIYLPLDEMAQYQVTETHIKNRISDTHMLALFKNQVARAKQMMLSGAPLGSSIPGRFGFQLRLMIAGGLRICNSLENLNQDCFARPRLTKADWLEMVKYAIIGHKY
jgi:squalene synthase HpnC